MHAKCNTFSAEFVSEFDERQIDAREPFRSADHSLGMNVSLYCFEAAAAELTRR
jgi:hypothetical protein